MILALTELERKALIDIIMDYEVACAKALVAPFYSQEDKEAIQDHLAVSKEIRKRLGDRDKV